MNPPEKVTRTQSATTDSSLPGAPGRRRFIRKGTLLAMSAAIGAHIPFGRFLLDGMVPVALAAAESPLKESLEGFGKRPDLIVLGDRPFVAETPAHLLDDDVTPLSKMFVRNNGLVPAPAVDPDSWVLRIDGEAVRAPREYTLNPCLTPQEKPIAESISCVPMKSRVALQARNCRFS